MPKIKPTKKVHELNRRLFREWSKGTLLAGSDEALRCDVVEADLELGATLYLVDDSGKRVSKITSDGKGYTEDAP